ncbi:c2f protein [Stylonychia lemnae]|uniref:C2f protein n=1 Tax=Stylonychia lemnae TaxID=5949 RepID=A0A078A1U4_STYLE|nr:c2f protein [Stylonychia lemnae]|eukprot:CDW76216.1 c2f protein [Stylonychia lemnae]
MKSNKDKEVLKSQDLSDSDDDINLNNQEEEEFVSSDDEQKESYSLQRVEPKLPKTFHEKQNMPRLILVLEQANIETTKTKRGIELINCDDHQKLITKMKKSYEDYRPDCLLALLDSPLNKAGLLQVYLKTNLNVLVEVNPQMRIPRTYKRFLAMMAQLLTKMKIKSTSSSVTLMKVIKNPVTEHFPLGVKKIGTSTKGKLLNVNDYVKQIMSGEQRKKPIVFVIGAVSVGNPAMEADYIDECICMSKYSLSAAACCSMVCDAFEDLWGIQ